MLHAPGQGSSPSLLVIRLPFAAEWFYVMENNYSFWLLFVGIMTTVAVFLMLWPHVAIAITCSVYGSLFAILAIDYFTEGSLKYIFITLIRRVLVPGFHSAFVYPPYHGAGTFASSRKS